MIDFLIRAVTFDGSEEAIHRKASWPGIPQVNHWVYPDAELSSASQVASVWHWMFDELPAIVVEVVLDKHEYEKLRKLPHWQEKGY